MPPMPATCCAQKRSWPGTSTKPRRIRLTIGRGDFTVGETDIDGDAAPLLLSQSSASMPVRALNQRGFAVIDMSGGADDDRLHQRTV